MQSPQNKPLNQLVEEELKLYFVELQKLKLKVKEIKNAEC